MNQRCQKDQIYSLARYQLRSTDPNIMVSLCFKGRPQLPGGPHFTRQGYLYIPRGRWLPVPSLAILFISITRGPSPYVHNLRVYSISEEAQSEPRGATPNFWPQLYILIGGLRSSPGIYYQFSRRNDYLQLSPTIQNCLSK